MNFKTKRKSMIILLAAFILSLFAIFFTVTSAPVSASEAEAGEDRGIGADASGKYITFARNYEDGTVEYYKLYAFQRTDYSLSQNANYFLTAVKKYWFDFEELFTGAGYNAMTIKHDVQTQYKLQINENEISENFSSLEDIGFVHRDDYDDYYYTANFQSNSFYSSKDNFKLSKFNFIQLYYDDLYTDESQNVTVNSETGKYSLKVTNDVNESNLDVEGVLKSSVSRPVRGEHYIDFTINIPEISGSYYSDIDTNLDIISYSDNQIVLRLDREHIADEYKCELKYTETLEAVEYTKIVINGIKMINTIYDNVGVVKTQYVLTGEDVLDYIDLSEIKRVSEIGETVSGVNVKNGVRLFGKSFLETDTTATGSEQTFNLIYDYNYKIKYLENLGATPFAELKTVTGTGSEFSQSLLTMHEESVLISDFVEWKISGEAGYMTYTADYSTINFYTIAANGTKDVWKIPLYSFKEYCSTVRQEFDCIDLNPSAKIRYFDEPDEMEKDILFGYFCSAIFIEPILNIDHWMSSTSYDGCFVFFRYKYTSPLNDYFFTDNSEKLRELNSTMKKNWFTTDAYCYSLYLDCTQEEAYIARNGAESADDTTSASMRVWNKVKTFFEKVKDAGIWIIIAAVIVGFIVLYITIKKLNNNGRRR